MAQDTGSLRPIPATHTLPPYPIISVRLNEQGTTLVEVHITPEGRVDDCRIVQSSGFERLDYVVCLHVTEAWRWQPPAAAGKPVDARTQVSVTMDLKNATLTDFAMIRPVEASHTMPGFPMAAWQKQPTPLNELAATLMRVHLTGGGAADDCTVVQSSGSALLDQTACAHVKRVWRWPPRAVLVQANGHPSLAAITWDTATAQALPFRLTLGALSTTCAIQDPYARDRMCDGPLYALHVAVEVRLGHDQSCGYRRDYSSYDEEQAAFRKKVLPWLREHPETWQESALIPAGDYAFTAFVCEKRSGVVDPPEQPMRAVPGTVY